MRAFWHGLFSLLFALMVLPHGAAGQQTRFKLLVLGDSLVAGYGLPPEQAFPAALQTRLKADGHEVEIVNGGVSGDTSSGGLARLDWTLGEGVNGVIVELGANDMLRGIEPAETEKALDAILTKLARMKLPVMLAGMLAAPGMGKNFEAQFNGIYLRLAEKHGVLLYPFFLNGVANDRQFLLNDGMHPNRKGVEVIVSGIYPKVLELIAQMQKN